MKRELKIKEKPLSQKKEINIFHAKNEYNQKSIPLKRAQSNYNRQNQINNNINTNQKKHPIKYNKSLDVKFENNSHIPMNPFIKNNRSLEQKFENNNHIPIRQYIQSGKSKDEKIEINKNINNNFRKNNFIDNHNTPVKKIENENFYTSNK